MPHPTAIEIEAVRREALGTAEDDGTLTDDDIAYQWAAAGGSLLLAAALACEQLAARAAAHFRWSADGQSIDMTGMQKQYQERADRLRWRASTSGTLALARADESAGAEFA